MVNEEQFDQDLENYVTAVNGYVTAAQALIAALKAGVDYSTEDTTVTQAAETLAIATGALSPTAAPSQPAASAQIAAVAANTTLPPKPAAAATE